MNWKDDLSHSCPHRYFTPNCTFAFAFVIWAAANGGVTNGGLRGVWPPFPEIGRNRPFSPFFCLFCPFPEGLKSTWKIQKTEEKGLFPQISSDFLQPPSLKPPFAAPRVILKVINSEIIFFRFAFISVSMVCGFSFPKISS